MLFHTILLKNGNCDIYLENDNLNCIGKVAREKVVGKNTIIISDSNVSPLYSENVKRTLEANGFTVSVAVIEAGEKSKTIFTVNDLYKGLYKANISRSDIIIALGGGVVGDIVGFVAASYLRGVAYIQVPSSLLAMVDSSIGGKTGVDLPFGKNLVGAFYQPKAIITDISLLKTLPNNFYIDGLAEVIKYGCIKDISIFNALEGNVDNDVLFNVIKKCILIKSGVVERDEFDLGERMLLNFGHTFGHSIEKCQNYVGLSHGRAIAIGMVIASKIGEELKVTKKGTTERIIKLLEKCNLPISVDIKAEKLFEAIGADKKRLNNVLNFIFLEEIGVSIIHKMTIDELMDAYLRRYNE